MTALDISTFKQRLEERMDANCVAIQVPRLSVCLSVCLSVYLSVRYALMIYGLAEEETN